MVKSNLALTKLKIQESQCLCYVKTMDGSFTSCMDELAKITRYIGNKSRNIVSNFIWKQKHSYAVLEECLDYVTKVAKYIF